MLKLLLVRIVWAETHTEREFYDEEHAAAEKEVHGLYPGEGHEAAHAEQLGDFGEGHSFHEHQERYGPFHELHGQFNDGHSRMEHQNMYQHNGGLNEHISGKTNDNGLHGGKMGGHSGAGGGSAGFGGHSGQDGIGGYGGDGAGTDFGCASCGIGYIGEHGLSGHGDCGAHGAKGFHHGNGTPYNGDDGGGHAGYGGYGAQDGHGGHGGRGHLGNHVDRNHAAFGPEGLLTPAAGELSFGGAYHEVQDGMGHHGKRFFTGPEHAMFHDMQGHGVPANVVDFYDDVGVIDPTTGRFAGGYMHGESYKGYERSSHKAQEIARNMAAGNGFRRVLLSEGLHGRMHGHYGQGGQTYAGAPAHSAAVAAAEGISSSNGSLNTASDVELMQRLGASPFSSGDNSIGGQALSGYSADLMERNADHAASSRSVAEARNIELSHQMNRSIEAANESINEDLNVASHMMRRSLEFEGENAIHDNVEGVGMARHMASSHTPTENIVGLKTKANLQMAAAKVNLMKGNIGRANMHMKEARLNNLKASNISLNHIAKEHLLAAKNAAQHGDIAAANAYEAGAHNFLKTGRESIADYAHSIGIDTTHHDESVLFGGEMHAEKARLKALKAEKLRRQGLKEDIAGNQIVANNILAKAAVTAAEGRAENGFGVALNQISENNIKQTQMASIDNVHQEGIKEAIALQDNMHKIATGNPTPLNKTVAETIQDINLKQMAGMTNVTNKIANDPTGVTAEQMEDVIAENKDIDRKIGVPPLKDAFILSNADEIAERLIDKENARIRDDLKKKQCPNPGSTANPNGSPMTDPYGHPLKNPYANPYTNPFNNPNANPNNPPKYNTTPQEILGIVDQIPPDADSYDIENGNVKLPIKVYDPKVAENDAEKEALEAQNRLRDDLRGTITSHPFDSPLNVLETEKGYLNIPESVESLDVEDGRAYYTEEGKAKMDKEGIDTSFMEHKINTGERADMANGIGYYVAMLSGVKIDYPNPRNPKPKMVARSKESNIDLSEATGLDVAKGALKLIPWTLYLKLIRPKVTKPVILDIPKIRDRVSAPELPNTEVKENVFKLLSKDKKMLRDVAHTKKSIIVNPDGQAFIQVKPAYGVVQRFDINKVKEILPSNLVSAKKYLKHGQNGVDEMFGETDGKHIPHSEMELDLEDKDIKEDKLETVSLEHAVADKNTDDLVPLKNAFDRNISSTKQKIKESYGSDIEDTNTADDIGISLITDDIRKKRTTFEKYMKPDVQTKPKVDQDKKKEKDELQGIFIYEPRLAYFKKKVSNVKTMPDMKLLRVVYEYLKANLQDSIVSDDSEPLDCAYRKVKEYGIEYIVWKDITRKELLNTVREENKINLHEFYRQSKGLSDKILRSIWEFYEKYQDCQYEATSDEKQNFDDIRNKFTLLFGKNAAKAFEIVTSSISSQMKNVDPHRTGQKCKKTHITICLPEQPLVCSCDQEDSSREKRIKNIVNSKGKNRLIESEIQDLLSLEPPKKEHGDIVPHKDIHQAAQKKRKEPEKKIVYVPESSGKPAQVKNYHPNQINNKNLPREIVEEVAVLKPDVNDLESSNCKSREALNDLDMLGSNVIVSKPLATPLQVKKAMFANNNKDKLPRAIVEKVAKVKNSDKKPECLEDYMAKVADAHILYNAVKNLPILSQTPAKISSDNITKNNSSPTIVDKNGFVRPSLRIPLRNIDFTKKSEFVDIQGIPLRNIDSTKKSEFVDIQGNPVRNTYLEKLTKFVDAQSNPVKPVLINPIASERALEAISNNKMLPGSISGQEVTFNKAVPNPVNPEKYHIQTVAVKVDPVVKKVILSHPNAIPSTVSDNAIINYNLHAIPEKIADKITIMQSKAKNEARKAIKQDIMTKYENYKEAVKDHIQNIKSKENAAKASQVISDAIPIISDIAHKAEVIAAAKNIAKILK